MNIKSLLLGSAAAATAFTGAQAADAIVIAEPEPMEYVRICDAYGAGYFYIPGTETCLRISGWVRYQIDTADRGARATWTPATGASVSASVDGNLNIGSRSLTFTAPTDATVIIPAAGGAPAVTWGGATAGTPAQRAAYLAATSNSGTGALFTPKDEGLNKRGGAQINFDARSETEYGTLRGWVQLEGANTPNATEATDVAISINRAVIQLGGLWMGYADSLFSSSSNIGGSSLGNYGGFNFADTGIYHYQQRHQIGYQFSGSNGFWGGVSVEHDNNLDYTPDIVGKVAWSQGWGGVWLAAGYDDTADGMGVRGGVQGNFGALTARFDAYYASNAFVEYGRSARWAVQGFANYQINPQFAVNAAVEYRKDLATNTAIANALLGLAGYDGTGIASGMHFSDSHAWVGQVGVNWQPVQNFMIGADVTHGRERYNIASGVTPAVTAGSVNLRQDWTAVRVRFQRNF